MNLGLVAQLQGLRDDPIPPFGGGGGGIGFAAVFQMLLALGLVLLLVRWLAPKLIARFVKKPNVALGSEVTVQESASVAGGQILLVSVRGRTLLVGVGTGGFATLADLTEEPLSDGALKGEADFDKVLERLKRLQG